MAILIIEHSNLTGSHRLGERLLDDGHRLVTVRVHLGEELPTDLDEIDGVISGGGPQSPLSNDEPWIEKELSKKLSKKQLQHESLRHRVLDTSSVAQQLSRQKYYVKMRI